jgi:hypothetical protein
LYPNNLTLSIGSVANQFRKLTQETFWPSKLSNFFTNVPRNKDILERLKRTQQSKQKGLCIFVQCQLLYHVKSPRKARSPSAMVFVEGNVMIFPAAFWFCC